MKQEVKVENMTCAGCANTVKQRFAGIPSVASVEVNLDKKTAILESSERISDEVLAEVLEGTNYNIIK